MWESSQIVTYQQHKIIIIHNNHFQFIIFNNNYIINIQND